MGRIAFLFSGQGAQYTGMGKELRDVSESAAKVFSLADRRRPGTSSQCFSADGTELSQTVNTQPCVYCVDLAAAEALREAGVTPDYAAGFSLGEIAALTFCGVFSPQDGFSFVCRRGRYMDDAAKQAPGGMVAVLKLPEEMVDNICSRCGRVYPVNYNCPGQIAVAGDKDDLQRVCAETAAAGGRAVPLSVSGAFHSPFMDQASSQVREALTAVSFSPPSVPVYSDYMADLYGEKRSEILENLAMQVNHPVYWRKILENLRAKGVDIFVEVGPGKVLSGLVRKTLTGVQILHVEDKESLRKTLSAIRG